MPKYIVPFVQVASHFVEVEAESKEEALELAYEEAYAQPCHQCSQEIDLHGDWEALPDAEWSLLSDERADRDLAIENNISEA